MLVKKSDPMNAIDLNDTLEKMETYEFQLVKKSNIRELLKLTSTALKNEREIQ